MSTAAYSPEVQRAVFASATQAGPSVKPPKELAEDKLELKRKSVFPK
jgi:hypothetical protein